MRSCVNQESKGSQDHEDQSGILFHTKYVLDQRNFGTVQAVDVGQSNEWMFDQTSFETTLSGYCEHCCLSASESCYEIGDGGLLLNVE